MSNTSLAYLDKEKSNANKTTNGVTTPMQNPVSSTPYEDAYKKAETVYKQGATEQKKYLEDSYKKQVTGVNADYDRTANQAYVQYRQNQKALPAQLSRIGMTGGATENAYLKLQTAYGSTLADNEYNRNKAISDAETSYLDRVNTVDTTLNQNLANSYNSALQQDTAYGIQQQEIARLEEKEAKEKTEAEQKQTAIREHNNIAYAEIADLETQGYEVKTWLDAEGRVYYQKMNNTKEQQAEVDKHNNEAYKEIALHEAMGQSVKTWTDSSGKVYFELLGNDEVKKNVELAALDKVNNKNQREAAKLQAAGYEVYTWTDERGYFHFQRGPKKTTSSSTKKEKKKEDEKTNNGGSTTTNKYNSLSTNLANAMMRNSDATTIAYWGAKIDEAYSNGELTKAQYQKLVSSLK